MIPLVKIPSMRHSTFLYILYGIVKRQLLCDSKNASHISIVLYKQVLSCDNKKQEQLWQGNPSCYEGEYKHMLGKQEEMIARGKNKTVR